MTEAVTIIPQGGLDANDDPVAAGSPFTVNGCLVAPGNTTVRFGADGNLDQVAFTVYVPTLKIKGASGWIPISTALTGKFNITVRGQTCLGRAQEWNEGGRGGVVILATADTGTTE